MYPFLLAAADVWPQIERGGERRVLILKNPGLQGRHASTDTLLAGIQIVRPHESAPCHRHWASAIRFVIKGNGIGYTAVQGEKLVMDDYDLVLNPSMDWHDHHNGGSSPLVWLDVLDVPLLTLLQLSYVELHEENFPIVKPADYSERIYGDKITRPAKAGRSYQRRRPYIYKWRDIHATLMSTADSDPFDGVALEYINPVTNGSTLPTFTCCVQRLRPGEHTQAHRHTPSAVYHVIEGKGYSVINGLRIEWGKGDSFALPHWMWHEHVNLSDRADAILFSASDTAFLESIGLNFEEEYKPDGGYQVVRGHS